MNPRPKPRTKQPRRPVTTRRDPDAVAAAFAATTDPNRNARYSIPTTKKGPIR